VNPSGSDWVLACVNPVGSDWVRLHEAFGVQIGPRLHEPFGFLPEKPLSALAFKLECKIIALVDEKAKSSILTMGSTFYSVHHHIIFSTKERRPLVRAEWRGQLHAYMGGTVRGLGAIAERVNGVEDHVHLLIGLKTTQAPADLVRELKKSSSTWVADHHDPSFGWQEGYAIFSVSWTHCASVSRYIERQEIHHRKVNFTEELQRLLKRNGVDYDPKWLL